MYDLDIQAKHKFMGNCSYLVNFSNIIYFGDYIV